MGWEDDDEAGSDPAESDPVNKRVNKYAKPLLPHDLYHFLQWQDLSPISFARIYTDRHSYVIKQYMKYSRQYERTCTFRPAIKALEKYHKLTTKIIYSLIQCCGGIVASTDDDTDVDVDEDDAVAVAVPIPASGIEEDPDDDVVEAVVVTQSETPDMSDLISSGNQYLVAFTEAMIDMAKKNRSKGGRRTKNPPSEIPQYIQDQATIIIRKEFSKFQASDSIHSTRILKSVISAAWSSINTQIDQSNTESDAALLKKVVVNICAELRAIFPKRAMFYLMSSLAKKQKQHFVWQATMALSVVSNQLSMTPHQLLLQYKTFWLFRKTSKRRHLSRLVSRSFSIHYVDNGSSNEFSQIYSAVKYIECIYDGYGI